MKDEKAKAPDAEASGVTESSTAITTGETAAADASTADRKKPKDVVVLTDGRTASLRRAKGRDLEKGAASARNPGNPMSLMMGVIAQVTTIANQPITYEDVLDLDM